MSFIPQTREKAVCIDAFTINLSREVFMSKKVTFAGTLLLILLLVGFFSPAISQQEKGMTAEKAKTDVKSEMTSLISRGEFLVTAGDCNTCHSPKVSMMPIPEADKTRLLSGHPANETIAALPADIFGPNGWGGIGSPDFTAWAGGWGVSYAANLTPDQATGLGAWTEDVFIKTFRTGKHMGAGRDILPPMPWYAWKDAKDSDLKAIFAYLKSLTAVSNQVPQPVMAPPPPDTKGK
jgi:cytochrome c553